MTAGVQRELAVERAIRDWLERPGSTVVELAATVQALIADAEKRAAAAALEDFAALIDRGPTFPLPPSIFSAMARERAALDPAGADSGEGR